MRFLGSGRRSRGLGGAQSRAGLVPQPPKNEKGYTQINVSTTGRNRHGAIKIGVSKNTGFIQMARVRIEQIVPMGVKAWGKMVYVDGEWQERIKTLWFDLHGWEEMMRPIDGFRQWVEFEGEVQIEDYPDGTGRHMTLVDVEFVSYGGEKCQQ